MFILKGLIFLNFINIKIYRRVIGILLFFLLLSLFISCTNVVESTKTNKPVIGDYYVSTTGNDSNPGTSDLPWKTIQKAANSAGAGNVIVVRNGTYNELVTISISGTNDDNRVTLISETLHGSQCFGFKINGNYITVDGFSIEAEVNHNWIGIYIRDVSGINIRNCSINECPMGGIRSIGTENTIFTKNIMSHNGQFGISLIGSRGIIDSNEIYRTVQYHPKGDEPGFSGNDADGLRVFGDGHIIRSNSIVNIADPNDSGNIDPHSDCIQTWDGGAQGRPIMTNAIIEGNFFSVSHPYGKGIMISALNGNACHDVTIRNNIIEFSDMGISAYNGDYYNIFVYNNVFKSKLNDKPWGTSVSFSNIQNYTYLNNITVDCHPEHRKIEGDSGIIDYNLAWNSDGSKPTLVPGLQEHEIISINPLFVKYTGVHGENNYQLSNNSPAIDAGIEIIECTSDFDGVYRPQGVNYDMGPFELKKD